jgi:hypothetical protein
MKELRFDLLMLLYGRDPDLPELLSFKDLFTGALILLSVGPYYALIYLSSSSI